MSTFELGDATLRRRNAGLFATLLTVAGIGLALMVSALIGHLPWFGAGVVAWNAGMWATLLAWKSNPWARTARGIVSADERGLHLDGRRLLRRERMKRAYLQPSAVGDAPVIRVYGQSWLDEVEVPVPDEEKGRALLAAMRIDTSHAIVQFHCPSPILQSFVLRVASGVLFLAALRGLASLGEIVPAYFLAMALLFAMVVYFPMTVSVGADGLKTSWFGVGRFLAYKDIATVASDEKGVLLTMTSGKTERLDTAWYGRTGSLLSRVFGVRGDVLAERIQQGRFARALDLGDTDTATLLKPDARPIREWIGRMRALGAGASASFRAAAIPEERLWRLLENPAIDDAARAGAAVALSAGADDEVRARLRLATEASVSPKIRVAIEAAASGDDDEIARAVEELREKA